MISSAAKKTGCRQTAQELVQDVFVDIFKNKDRINASLPVKGYIYTALQNKIYNHYRQKLRAQQYQERMMKMPVELVETTESGLHSKELSKIISDHIEGLPERCRAVFLLRREKNLSNKEISEKLQISINTVEQHMRHALRKLRASLGHYLLLITWLALYLSL